MRSSLLTLVRKDISVEVRRKTSLWIQAGFTLAAAVMVASAASFSQAPWDAAAVGIILTSLFMGLYASYSAFIGEAYRGTLDGLRLAPVERWVIVASKLIVAFLMLLVHLFLFTLIVSVFTGLEVAWAPLALWSVSTSLFLASVSAFVSAGMAFAEDAGGPLALVLLVLSIPYLRLATPVASSIFYGATHMLHELLTLAGIAAAFTGLTLGLSSTVIE